MKNFKTYGQFIAEAYSDEERKELADKGFALSDGSFPIKDLKDLKNAIQAYGRAKDQARAAKFIVKRAKALGAEDLIPDTEDFQKSLGESVVTEAKDPKDLEIKDIKFDIALCKKSKSVALRRSFSDIIEKGQDALKILSESVVNEAFKFSEKEVKDIAELIAKAIAKVDNMPTAVHDMEFDKGRGAGFEISIDGEKYDGGSYVVRPNGDVVNSAIGNSFPNAIYAKIGDKDINKVMKNIQKFESTAYTQVPAKTIAITEGTDLGGWNQGGPKGNQNVLITQYVGPKDIEDLGMGRKCIQINVGRDYVQLNPADIIELQDILKSYKVK
tara:strand:+ start:20 stop:1003 length:984 start_codon:yes stop_codon:yes gene_type:complete